MGGRGASSGISEKGKPYGSQYKTVLSSGNIKFVKAKTDHPESLFETQTNGRIYVTVGGNDLLRITYYDTENKRTKQIDMDHSHVKMIPHTHHGYYHKENDGKKGATGLSVKEKAMVERVKRIWYNHFKQK
jgi:hypothetical protein|nr:MAG TPA: hypothetical protein [Caudoviricetes sp.]